jgi:hypothetical protein
VCDISIKYAGIDFKTGTVRVRSLSDYFVSKIDFRAYIYIREYCGNLVPIWHKYTLVCKASANELGGHASLNMHILLS